MYLLKICSIILIYFLSRVALAENCELVRGYSDVKTVCWNDEIKGWISKNCTKNNCEALRFFDRKVGDLDYHYEGLGQNTAAMSCRALKLGVRVLKDSKNNEQSYCLFSDNTLVDSNAVERHIQ